MKATIYIVTVDDRHSGPYTYIYAEEVNALAKAMTATSMAQEHYRVPAVISPFAGEVYRSNIEDGCTVTVRRGRIEDVEDSD